MWYSIALTHCMTELAMRTRGFPIWHTLSCVHIHENCLPFKKPVVLRISRTTGIPSVPFIPIHLFSHSITYYSNVLLPPIQIPQTSCAASFHFPARSTDGLSPLHSTTPTDQVLITLIYFIPKDHSLSTDYPTSTEYSTHNLALR
jgi:hypothetical protein